MNFIQPAPVTMVEVLQTHADRIPNKPSFCFLIDGEEEGPRLTFAELDRQARAIAATLRDVAGPGDRALLLYPPGIEFVSAFFGCLYAAVTPVPAYPPQPAPAYLPRLERQAQGWQAVASIAGDCRPALVLTTQAQANLLGGSSAMPPLDGVRWLATDQIDPATAGRWREPDLGETDTAFLQYTSGSTAAPRGVIVTHRNLMFIEHMLQWGAGHVGEGSGVCWLPLYHDMGLIGGVLQAVYYGGLCVLMSPLHFLQRPVRWLRALSHFRAIASGGPNFAYELCVQRISAEEKVGLDLGNWSVAVVGAEPVRAATLQRFADAFTPHGFRPEAYRTCYGLAEAFAVSGPRNALPVVRHVSASALEQGRVVGGDPGDPDTRTLVGCGRSWMGQQIVIADPNTQTRCPPGTVGEIWFAGPSVAQGYWGRPEETERTFRAFLHDSGEGPFLRTGDLGFVQDEELFITGRLKDLIIIRGRNYYPEDIEDTVAAAHPWLRRGCGAAFETGGDGTCRLVVVQEVDRRARDVDVRQLIRAIRQAVVERHDLLVSDVVLLEPASIPKTSSGKVQRHLCRHGYQQGTLRRWKGQLA